MANQEVTGGAIICHYGFLLLWHILRALSVPAAWQFYKWGIHNEFLLTDRKPTQGLQTTFFGQRLRTPVGIAAEVDRDGSILDKLIESGYGFGEFGTFTLEREDAETRTVYCPNDRAMCLEMRGYKNKGLSQSISMLSIRRRLPHFTGVSITTTAESEMSNLKQGAVMTYPAEFEVMTQKVAPYCDYIVANLTIPNTDLAERIYDETTVIPVLEKIKETARVAAPIATPKIVLKVPLDLSDIEIPVVARICQKAGIDAIIVAGPMNLAKHRKIPVKQKLPMVPFSALVGAPTKKYALSLIRRLYKETEGKIPLIANGGIFTGKDVYEYMAAGASLVQIHSALIFDGPFAFKKIHKELFQLMKKNGFNTVDQIVGSTKDENG